MYKYIFIAITALFIQGCVSIPDTETTMKQMHNIVSSGTSQFDGTKHIRMSKIACSTSIRFELYQDTVKHNNNIVLLNAGTNTITNIGNGDSLLIKIDGKLHKLQPVDSLTKHDTNYYGYDVQQPFSNKTYIVNESLIREIAASNEFLAKLYLLDKTYVEGKCSFTTLAEAKESAQGTSYSSYVTQETVDTSNRYSALSGFRDFVRLMDTTKW